MKKEALTISYILSYLAIGFSINNHIILSIITFFISFSLLGLIIYQEKFTFLFNKPLLLTLIFLQVIIFICFYNTLIEISCAFLITMAYQAVYSTLFFGILNSLDISIKKHVNNYLTCMICLLMSILLVAQLFFIIYNPSIRILSGYWGCCLLVACLPLINSFSLINVSSKQQITTH